MSEDSDSPCGDKKSNSNQPTQDERPKKPNWVDIRSAESPSASAVAPNSTVYVANLFDDTVSVITANAVVATIPVGSEPAAFGQFIQPLLPAGQQASSTCNGKKSVSALSNQFGNLTNAAAALGFPSVKALKATVTGFCGS